MSRQQQPRGLWEGKLAFKRGCLPSFGAFGHRPPQRTVTGRAGSGIRFGIPPVKQRLPDWGMAPGSEPLSGPLAITGEFRLFSNTSTL